MTYSMDNRIGKGTAVCTRNVTQELLKSNKYDYSLVHYDDVVDSIYTKENEIMMPKLKLPYATRFIRQMLFYWKYRNDKFDIMFWFQPRLYPFFWLAPAKKLVVIAHGAADITAPAFFCFSRSVFNWLMVHFNKHLDAVIGASEFGRDEIIQFYKIPHEKVYAVYQGGSEYFKNIPKDEAKKIVKEKFGFDYLYILNFGRILTHKNIISLVGAYIKFRDKYPDRKEHLINVGKPVNDYEEVYELARNSKYKDQIHFVDYVESEAQNAVYSAAELLVFPSLNEGFGLPVVEAFASGIPVVTSNVTSLPEIAGDAGITVDPLDLQEIADAMYRVLSDDKLKADLIARGIERAKLFTWKHTSMEVEKIFEKVLSEND